MSEQKYNNDYERRHVMQWLDNLHKIITYITGIGVVWLVSSVDTNQNNALIFKTKLEAIEQQVSQALTNRYTAADNLKDMQTINFRFNTIEDRIDRIEKEQISRTVPVKNIDRIDGALRKHLDDDLIHKRR